MNDRRRIIIKRRPSDQPDAGIVGIEEGIQEQGPQDSLAETPSYQERRVEETVSAQQLYERAQAMYEELMRKIEDIRNKDKTMQKVFQRQDFVDLRVVKKKLDLLSSMRSEVLSEAGPVEASLSEAISSLESEMARLEEVLFEKLVELESLRESEERGKRVDRAQIERLEAEAENVREEMSKIRQRIADVHAKVEELKTLSHKINELTTSKELAEPLLQELVSKFRDERRVMSAIEKIMQDETVPREYAIIYFWKRAFRPRIT